MKPFANYKKDRLFPITLIGEILVDEIYNQDTGEQSVLFGGSPANIAMNLVDIGIQEIQYAGALGEDELGELLYKHVLNNHNR